MTNLQKHTEKVLKEFDKNCDADILKNIKNPSCIVNFPGKYSPIAKGFRKFLLQALSERDEVIIKMLEGLKMEKCLESKCTDEEAHLEQLYGHNTALDKAIEIIKGEDE